ncbi:MAG TPA: heavy metal sensor histidine kinase [Verrucomicrobiae bacterium]|nr:heavy metal sensor histidine kinase [Verrucomicrobiae bacterium]
MSSKTAKPTPGGARKPRRWWSSITFRLTLLYMLSAVGILTVCCILVYWMLARNVDHLAGQFLQDEVHDVRAALRELPSNPRVLDAEINMEGTYPNYYARVMDRQGREFGATPHMGEVAEGFQFPPPAEATESSRQFVKARASDGRWFLLGSAWGQVGREGETQMMVQVALDISKEQRLVQSFTGRLVGVILLGLGLSTAAGIVVAGMGMRPLTEITSAAQRTGPTQLHERIGSTHWPQELTALAEAFDGMLDRLEDSFARLSQFSADMAHELRTPINNLMGEAEVSLSKPRTVEEYQRVLASSLEECGRLARLIDSMLFLARAENAETELKRSALDVRAEIEAVREFYDVVAEEQGVEVACGGDGRLNADPLLFRQAVSNLLSNALHYTPRGGKVVISVARPGGGWVDIAVADTGTGIDPEHLPRIFDRFYRADRSRSQHPQGLGLGLAIVKSILTLHGGTVAITSTTGAGTTVVLRFPGNAA